MRLSTQPLYRNQAAFQRLKKVTNFSSVVYGEIGYIIGKETAEGWEPFSSEAENSPDSLVMTIHAPGT